MPSGHAIGLKLDSGVELLIHVGIDTVNLNGEGFDVKVEKGQRVAAGDLLMTFSPEVIKNAGYSLVTPVLVTNTGRFAEVEGTVGDTRPGSELIKVTTK